MFESGASRNSDEGKLDYEGFMCPFVLKRYAEFMHKHRYLEDGSLRDSDNWQKGIPQDQLVKSLLRHVHDLWLHQRGFKGAATENAEDSACAIIFNAMAYLRGCIVIPPFVEAEKEAGKSILKGSEEATLEELREELKTDTRTRLYFTTVKEKNDG